MNMKILFNNLNSIYSSLYASNTSNAAARVSRNTNPGKIEAELISRNIANCYKAYSNISFGSREKQLAKKLTEITGRYQKDGVIVSVKDGFIDKFSKQLCQGENRPLIFFVQGPSGAGKSTQAKIINNVVNSSIVGENTSSLVIHGDCFYTDNEENMKKADYDYAKVVAEDSGRETASAFDLDYMNKVLNNVRDEKTNNIEIPTFDYRRAKRISLRNVQKPDKLLIFDSLYAPSQFKFDAHIYIDVDRKTRDARVGGDRFLERNAGSTPEEGMKFAKIVGDVHDKCILPSKEKADIVISGNQDLQVVTRMYEEIVSCCLSFAKNTH